MELRRELKLLVRALPLLRELTLCMLRELLLRREGAGGRGGVALERWLDSKPWGNSSAAAKPASPNDRMEVDAGGCGGVAPVWYAIVGGTGAW